MNGTKQKGVSRDCWLYVCMCLVETESKIWIGILMDGSEQQVSLGLPDEQPWVSNEIDTEGRHLKNRDPPEEEVVLLAS